MEKLIYITTLLFFPCCTYAQYTAGNMEIGVVIKLNDIASGIAGSYQYQILDQVNMTVGVGIAKGHLAGKNYQAAAAQLMLNYQLVSLLDRVYVQAGLGGTGSLETVSFAKAKKAQQFNYGGRGAIALIGTISDHVALTGSFSQDYRMRKWLGHWRWEVGVGCLIKIY